jgi:hypothetical protein
MVPKENVTKAFPRVLMVATAHIQFWSQCHKTLSAEI